MADVPVLVVVSGPPGAGKTAIAEALRDRLGLPLVAKDTLKETLGERIDVANDRVASQRLGAAVFDVLGVLVRELLGTGVSAIVEGNFGVATRIFDALPPARIVQVHVTAGPATLHERLLRRDSHRHSVHYDREAADEIVARAAAGDWEPLPLDAPLVAVDTTSWPDVPAIVESVARQVRDGS